MMVVYRVALCTVLCALGAMHIALCVDAQMYCLIWVFFIIFKRQALIKTYRGLRDSYAKMSPKKTSAVTTVWALFGCSSRTTAWCVAGYTHGFSLHFFMAVVSKNFFCEV